MKASEIVFNIKFYVVSVVIILVSGVLIKYTSTGIIYLIENYRHKGNPAGKIIDPYMARSVELKVAMPHLNLSMWDKAERLKDSTNYFDYQSKIYHQPSRQTYGKLFNKSDRDNWLLRVNFYNKVYHKSFVLLLPNYKYEPSKLYFDVLPLKEIRITVNQDDLANPFYGSFATPIPALRFRGVNPLLYNSLNYDQSVEDFKYNVAQYLSFIIPKKVFEAELNFYNRSVNER